VPADAAEVNDVDFTSPREICGCFQLHARESFLQVFCGEFRPIRFEVGDFISDHLVFLPDWDVDVLQQKVGVAETQARQPVVLPFRPKTQRCKELQRARELFAAGDEGVEGGGVGVHDWFLFLRALFTEEVDDFSLV
jgi:hypothetical protein